MNLALNNGKIFFRGKLIEANLELKDGKIFGISKKTVSAEKEIDCSGKIILPGLIDGHVHFRVPGGEQKEDWKTGSLAALHGGVTTVIDMPNTNPPLTSIQALKEKKAIVEKDCLVNYFFHFGATNSNFSELKELSDAKIVSFKLFMGSSTGNMLVENPLVQKKIFEIAEKKNLVVSVHAEDEKIIKENIEKFENENKPTIHSKIRSNLAEKIAVKNALKLQNESKNKLHILHVSTKEAIALVKKAKSNDKKISCEVTPHHLFLTKKELENQGNFAKMNPPLRDKNDVAALWNGIKNGIVSTVGTDHAPHRKEEKEKNYWDAPSGVPGIETMLPLLLNAVNEKKLKLEKVVELCCENPAKIFSIKKKGFIEMGFDGDLVVVDLKKENTIHGKDLFTKCKWTPFEGWKLKGVVEKTIVGGKVLHEN